MLFERPIKHLSGDFSRELDINLDRRMPGRGYKVVSPKNIGGV